MSKLFVTRTPEDDDELWEYVYTISGFKIPRVAVCKEHCAPFDAFADAYFARSVVSVWKASRGFGGKSTLLGLLAWVEAITLGAQISVLGGSASQSRRVHEVTHELWHSPFAPVHLLDGDPTNFYTRLNNHAWIIALMASQKSVRGPHPQRLRLDEIDEMDNDILESAQGQPQEARGVESHTVMCLAGWSQVLTQRGEVPIRDVTTDDMVMTRYGWRRVVASVLSGNKDTLRLSLSNGRTITCTDNHRIATPDGWMYPRDMSVGQEVCGVRTDSIVSKPLVEPVTLTFVDPALKSLAGLALSPTTLGVDGVHLGVRMPLWAMCLGCVGCTWCTTSQNVGSVDNSFKMSGVDTRSVAAQMVQFAFAGHRPNQALVGPDVNTPSVHSPIHHSVPTTLGPTPDPAFGGEWSIGCDTPTLEPVFVVGITAGGSHDVFDLSVDGVPEFVADGIVVHNSSTHQYPDKTMTLKIKEAREKGWPVWEWCWRESMGTENEPGWLTPRMVERKRSEVSTQMWNVEYDLQEPSFDGRAIETDLVDICFDPSLGEYEGDEGSLIIAEEPIEGELYVTGVDWAQESDWTVIRTFKTGEVWQEVAFERLNRMPWPWMIGRVEKRLKKYEGRLVHDATGIGNVVKDLLDWPREQTTDFVMTGNRRTAMFVEYIAGIEQSEIRCPRITFSYEEHKYVTPDDLFGKGHPPDSFVAGALAWSIRKRLLNNMVRPGSITKESQWTLT